MKVKYSMILTAAILVSAPLKAAQIVHFDSESAIKAKISNSELTRLMVEGDRIVDVFLVGATLDMVPDERLGHLYLKPTQRKDSTMSSNIKMTITTEAGHAQDFTLIPQDGDVESIILKHPQAEPGPLEGGHGFRKRDLSRGRVNSTQFSLFENTGASSAERLAKMQTAFDYERDQRPLPIPDMEDFSRDYEHAKSQLEAGHGLNRNTHQKESVNSDQAELGQLEAGNKLREESKDKSPEEEPIKLYGYKTQEEAEAVFKEAYSHRPSHLSDFGAVVHNAEHNPVPEDDDPHEEKDIGHFGTAEMHRVLNAIEQLAEAITEGRVPDDLVRLEPNMDDMLVRAKKDDMEFQIFRYINNRSHPVRLKEIDFYTNPTIKYISLGDSIVESGGETYVMKVVIK